METMAPDAVYLAPEEARPLRAANGGLPPGYAVAGPAPQTRVLDVLAAGKTRRIGVVFFPLLDAASPAHRERQLNDLLLTGTRLRTACDVVIGMAPWPVAREPEFFSLAAERFDLILESGPEPGPRHPVPKRAVPVFRSADPGAGLAYIDLYAWPERGAPPGGQPASGPRRMVLFLDSRVQQDPAAAARIRRILPENAGALGMASPDAECGAPAAPLFHGADSRPLGTKHPDSGQEAPLLPVQADPASADQAVVPGLAIPDQADGLTPETPILGNCGQS